MVLVLVVTVQDCVIRPKCQTKDSIPSGLTGEWQELLFNSLLVPAMAGRLMFWIDERSLRLPWTAARCDPNLAETFLKNQGANDTHDAERRNLTR